MEFSPDDCARLAECNASCGCLYEPAVVQDGEAVNTFAVVMAGKTSSCVPAQIRQDFSITGRPVHFSLQPAGRLPPCRCGWFSNASTFQSVIDIKQGSPISAASERWRWWSPVSADATTQRRNWLGAASRSGWKSVRGGTSGLKASRLVCGQSPALWKINCEVLDLRVERNEQKMLIPPHKKKERLKRNIWGVLTDLETTKKNAGLFFVFFWLVEKSSNLISLSGSLIRTNPKLSHSKL